MSSYYIWLIIAFVLMAAEILGTDFFLLFLGCAALITAIISAVINISLLNECTIFGVLGLLSVVIWFVKHSKKKSSGDQSYVPNSGLQNYVGTKTTIYGVNDDSTVKVVINDTVYLAHSVTGEVFSPEDTVEVVSIDGNDRLVIKKC